MRNVKVGLFGVGLDAYWPQFDGLKARLEGYVRSVADRLKRPDVDVVDLGLIDTPPKALEAGHRFRAEDVDLIFLYVTTYALSATVLPVVRRARVPVVVLNLQPATAIDYARLSTERRQQYEQAKLMVTQSEDALKGSNFEFARNLADKADRLAKELQGR